MVVSFYFGTVSISIHALRVEGDLAERPTEGLLLISIHALRVEGDQFLRLSKSRHCDFYPRPPGGGRPTNDFLWVLGQTISIHALRVEGDSPECR